MSRPPPASSTGWTNGLVQGPEPPAGRVGHGTEVDDGQSESVPPLPLGLILSTRRESESPVKRHLGRRAELRAAEACAAAAARDGDPEAEAKAAAELARLLVARGTEFGLALRSAERSLALLPDAELRELLGGWYRGVGDWERAILTLRPLVEGSPPVRRARLRLRLAVLSGYSGDAAGAAAELRAAQKDEAQDATASELIGCIGGWAPEAVRPADAARAFLEGARRRTTKGDWTAAFENVLRAFESAPDQSAAAQELQSALESRGRYEAADEIRREHARALGDAGLAVHGQAIEQAVRAGEWARALGAALDAGWDRELDLDSALHAVGVKPPAQRTTGLDEIAERVGLFALVAARLESVADTAQGKARSSALLGLGQLWAGPLGDLDRAIDAWLASLIADPTCSEALAQLRLVGASASDQTCLVEALLAIGSRVLADPAQPAIACLRELAQLVAEGPGDPAPIVWIAEQLNARGRPDPELAALAARHAPLLELEEESLGRARQRLEEAVGAERVELLRQIAIFLRGRADEGDAYLRVLEELVRVSPEERTWQRSLERAAARMDRAEQWRAQLMHAAESSYLPAERARARMELARWRSSLGDPAGALETLRPLLSEPASQTGAWSRALCYAALAGERRWRANALLAISAPLAPNVRAELACVAAEDLIRLGELALARDAAEQAHFTDPSAGRPLATLARIAVELGTLDAPQVVERALGVVAPRGWLCSTLARAYSAQDEPVLALTWTQRWLSLCPGNLAAITALLARAAAAGDAERLEQAITWLLGQPLPVDQTAGELAVALTRMAELAPARAQAIGQRVLDAMGVKLGTLRETLLDVAGLAGAPALARAILERSLASEEGTTGTARSLLDLAERVGQAGEAELGHRVLVRACRAGANPQDVLDAIGALPAPTSGDGELAKLEARACALRELGGVPFAELAAAWREYGAGLWDLAEDYQGAMAAWRFAATLDSERGLERLVLDLWTCAGPEAAQRELEDASVTTSAKQLARSCSLLARLSADAGRSGDALAWAERALDLDPGEAEALAVAEEVTSPEQAEILARAYQRLGEASLGRYGERAVHYRAARQLERLGAYGLALGHAVLAFEALPSMGTTFRLLSRLAQRTGQIAELVSTVERVSALADDKAARAAWLRLAAARTGDSDEGLRQCVDALLAALSLDPSRATILELGGALGALIDRLPEEREISSLRTRRAMMSLLSGLSGPEGARIALAACLLALDTLHDGELGVAAVSQALRADPSLDDYAELTLRAGELGTAPAAVREVLLLVLEIGGAKYSNLGRAALEAARVLAEVLGDRVTRARLGLLAVERDPGNVELVQYVEQAALSADDSELLALVRRELEALARRTGEQSSLLCVLAELAERAQDVPAAAQFWLRASSLAADPHESERWGRRACEVLLGAGKMAEARQAVESLAGWLAPAAALELRVEVERRIGDPREFGQALEEFARNSSDAADRRAALLLQAARLGESAGESQQAIQRAQLAAQLDPRAPAPQLIARMLEYRQRGAGDAQTARATVVQLRQVQGSLTPTQRELLAFLTAEAQNVALGRDSARAELERALAECGPRPLVAAGLAECLAETGDSERALALCEVALGGDLRGLRSRGQLALLGASAAARAGEVDRGLALLAIAIDDPETRERARDLESELKASEESAEVVIDLVRRTSAPRAPTSPPVPVQPVPVGAIALTRAVRALPAAGAHRPALPAFPPTDDVEAKLVGALANGAVEAGLELSRLLANRPTRSHDLLRVCRQLTVLAPADAEVLRCVSAAAMVDHNSAYAHAVEHVRQSFTPGEQTVEVPSLLDQREQPERVRSILARDADAVSEALALVWDNAAQLFRRELAAYGVTGLERIQPGAPTPLGRAYGAASRLLGATRTALFQRHDADDVTLSVCLTSPPSLLLSGDARRESPELAYHVGAMLAAAMSERVLLFGLSEEQARDVLIALAIGFGPPGPQQRGQTNVSHLAEVLWQSVSARAQRRLRELSAEPDALLYEAAMANARRAIRRAGLLVAGDLGVAVRETQVELDLPSEPVATLEELARLAAELPEIADLVRLAVSPEFAEVRWQPGRGSTK